MGIKEFTVLSDSVSFIQLEKRFSKGAKINAVNEPEIFKILLQCESQWSDPVSARNQYTVTREEAPATPPPKVAEKPEPLEPQLIKDTDVKVAPQKQESKAKAKK